MRFLPIPAKITQWGLPLVKRFETSLMVSNKDDLDIQPTFVLMMMWIVKESIVTGFYLKTIYGQKFTKPPIVLSA